MSDEIRSAEALEAVVGKRSLGALMKSIDELDVHCQALLAVSPFAVVGLCDPRRRLFAVPAGGEPGFARPLSATRLRLPLDAVPVRRGDAGTGMGLLFFVPGLGETLRVNGHVASAGAGDGLVVEVEEAFVHCAKALLRSEFWRAPKSEAPAAQASTDTEPRRDEAGLHAPAIRRFLAGARFAAVASRDGAGCMDVSPKGDPTGFLRVLDAHTLAVPDRPGNQRTDTFHNVLESPEVGLLALAPGSDDVLSVSGRARLSCAPALLASMSVEGRAPKTALVVEVADLALGRSPALARSGLWDPARHVPAERIPRISAVLADHVKRSRARGLSARVIRGFASDRRIEALLERDYRKRLY